MPSKRNLCVYMKSKYIIAYIIALTLPMDISTLIFQGTVPVKIIKVGSSSLGSRTNNLMLAPIPCDKCGGASIEEALQMLVCAIKNKQRYHQKKCIKHHPINPTNVSQTDGSSEQT